MVSLNFNFLSYNYDLVSHNFIISIIIYFLTILTDETAPGRVGKVGLTHSSTTAQGVVNLPLSLSSLTSIIIFNILPEYKRTFLFSSGLEVVLATLSLKL